MFRHLVSREPLRLLVKIHLITEHYRAEGVMISTLARNRNCSNEDGRRLGLVFEILTFYRDGLLDLDLDFESTSYTLYH